MIKVQLDDAKRKKLKVLKKTRSHQSERVLYVLLSDEGLSIKQIAEKLDRHAHTVRYWIKAYIALGIDGLINKRPPGRTKIKGNLVEEELETALAFSPRKFGYQESGWSVRIMIDYLLQKGIEVKEDTVRRALKRNNWVYKRFAKSVPKNAPSKEEKRKRVEQMIDEIHLAKPDEVFFLDESNFMTGSYVQRGWFKKGEKKKCAAH